MERINLLYIIPFVFIQTVFVQGEIVFPNKPSPATFKTGETVSVVCTLSVDTPSSGDAVYQWHDKNENVITNMNSNISPYIRDYSSEGSGGKRLKIDNVTDDDAGSYKCSADVNGMKYEAFFELKVKASLTFKNCEPSQFGVRGKKSKIFCAGSAPGLTVSQMWEKNGLPLTPASGKYVFGADFMMIVNTSMEDESTYKFSASTEETDSESKFRLINFKVYIAPQIIEPILQTTAIVGREAQLFCKASGKPAPTIEWRKKGSTNVLRNTDRINITTKGEGDNLVQGILTFMSVVKEDEAEYSCEAKNLATEENQADAAMTSNELLIQTPPKIENTNDASGTEGSAANLVCEARGDPPPDIIWEMVGSQKTFTAGYSEEGVSVTSENILDEANPGSRLTLAFTTLAHEDAGEYECVARNLADTARKIVKLEVRYKPNFPGKDETTFYTWLENDESFITCTAAANPEPVFEWYKGAQKIQDSDSSFSIGQPVVNPDKPHESSSKLYVAYNGQNDEVVFGKYTCLAKNQVGSGNISMDLIKAERPKQPEVKVDKEDARHMEFLLATDSVKGPDVTHFKVVYKQVGSAEPAKEQMVEREYRDYIDANRKWTLLPINDLEASTQYVFTFYSKNAVGLSGGTEIKRSTPAISVPDMPQITSDRNSPFSDRIRVQWIKPSDGGAVILKYTLSYQQVEVNASKNPMLDFELLRKVTDPTVIDKIKDESYDLRHLIPGAFYQVTVYAHNAKGKSLGGQRIFKTREDPKYNPAVGGAPRIVPLTSATLLSCFAAIYACLKLTVLYV